MWVRCAAEQKLTDQRLPCSQIQVEVFNSSSILWRVARQQDHCVFCLDGDKAKGKDIPAAAVVALKNSVPEWAVLVQLNLLQLGFDLPHGDSLGCDSSHQQIKTSAC